MEPSRSASTCLCVGLVLLFNTRVESQANSLSITTVPMHSNQVSNSSRYYNQVGFITDFLLNNAGNITSYPSDLTIHENNSINGSNETLPLTYNTDESINQDSVVTTASRDNNTTTNELQVVPINSVPAVFSSVIDTLPVHPRIPRRSVARRRTKVRLNRHSTRVNPDLPVRFLLPPPIVKHKCSDHSGTPDPPFKIKPIVISSSTPFIPISAVAIPSEYVVASKPLQKKSEQKESSLINLPQNNRVFVPPPSLHLLPPPFSHEDYLDHHLATPQNTLPERSTIGPSLPQNNVFESSTKPHNCDEANRMESSSVTPILVVEDIREINNWISQSSPLPPVHSSSYEPIKSVEFINSNEPVRNMDNFPTADFYNQLVASTTSKNTPVYGKLNDHNNEYETQLCDKNHSIAANQPLHSDNVSPSNPQLDLTQSNFVNQPLSANDQIFFPDNHDISQNNNNVFIPNIPQKYTPNIEQTLPNDQRQPSPSHQISPNNQDRFIQDYQQFLLADNQKTLSTTNAHEFKLNNSQPSQNHDLTQSKPLCNESSQEHFTLDKQYNQQQYPSVNQYSPPQYSSDKQYSQQQLGLNNQYNQQQFPSDKQYNQHHLPLDSQYNRQFPAEKQYSQQQLSPNNQYKQTPPSEKNYEQAPLSIDRHYSQQQLLSNHQRFSSDKHYNQQQLNPEDQQEYVSNNQYHQQEVNPNDQHNFSPSYIQTSATQASVTREPGPFSKSSPFDHFTKTPTTPFPLSSTIETYPILRGPNIEQTLFNTGNFQVDNISFNNTDDSTVAMMNRPLLTQDVARMGMKITANFKMEQINKAKLNRGNYKYNHLNQFNFPDLNEPSRPNEDSKSSNLLLAETSYYKDRRGVHEITQTADLSVIPGTPGVDYPTLNRPPLKSDFSCRSVANHRGYVADPSTRCQVFYICVGSGPGEAMLCPNGTLFSQDFLVCDWWFNIDCQPYS